MLNLSHLVYHQTDTWPSRANVESASGTDLAQLAHKIYQDGVAAEIQRVMTATGKETCEGIGHVVLIAICAAIDSTAAFAKGSKKNKKGRYTDNSERFTCFVHRFFPTNYRGHEKDLYESFRCDGVHGWNLHRSAISDHRPDPYHLTQSHNHIRISVRDLFWDYRSAIDKYVDELRHSQDRQDKFRIRYADVRP